ncbi:phospholipase,galactolipase [Artemisia annua]|uniref:Phospholipase,galactolipase n=1 Tax=Artemisia annua TaxID=35608 RepID=A0A2U1QF84_ARTAN|nr:phospholipase,galactolipase [Artemisia annua]
MAELRILRLSGNPLEFLPENLPLHQLRHLSLAKIRIVGDDYLRVNVQMELWESWGLLLIWSPKKCSARMDEIIEVIPHKDPELQQRELEANAREEAREREWRQKTNDINSMLRKFSDPRPLIN